MLRDWLPLGAAVSLLTGCSARSQHCRSISQARLPHYADSVVIAILHFPVVKSANTSSEALVARPMCRSPSLLLWHVGASVSPRRFTDFGISMFGQYTENFLSPMILGISLSNFDLADYRCQQPRSASEERDYKLAPRLITHGRLPTGSSRQFGAGQERMIFS